MNRAIRFTACITFFAIALQFPFAAEAKKQGLRHQVQANRHDIRLLVNGLCAGDIATCTPVAGPAGPPGADGAPGTNGVDGADGSSCSVTQNDDGATISCTDDGSSATVMDGNASHRVMLTDMDLGLLNGANLGATVVLVVDAPFPVAVTFVHRNGAAPGDPVPPNHFLLANGLDFVASEGSSLTLVLVDLPSHGQAWVETVRSEVPAP